MNSKDLLYWGILIFGTLGSAYLVYGLLIRRPAIRDCQTKIQDIRDRIELMVKAGVLGEDDRLTQIMRSRCLGAYGILPKLDAVYLSLVESSPEASEKTMQDLEALKSAKISSPEIGDLAEKLDQILMKSVVINSPLLLVLFCLMAIVVIPLILFIGLGKWWSKSLTRAWSVTYDDAHQGRNHAVA